MLKKLREFYWRKKALRAIKRNCLKEIQTDRITVDWVSACIIERKQEGRRKELLEAQGKLKEDELFLKWIRTQK